jgi:pimeloyl-ACP methyl ester carboxylesterase
MDLTVPKLVLLPGLDGTGALFADLVAAIRGEYDSAVVRYPTSSFSGWSALASIIEASVPKSVSFVIVAESFSSPLAIQYAATSPANLKALVICAGFASNPLRGWRRAMAKLLLPVMFRISVPRAAVRALLIGDSAPPSLLSAVERAISSVDRAVLRERLRIVLACDVTQELKRVSVPMLYLQATNDRLVSKDAVRVMKAAKPEIEIVEIEGPHLLLQRQPARTAEVIGRFVQEFG